MSEQDTMPLVMPAAEDMTVEEVEILRQVVIFLDHWIFHFGNRLRFSGNLVSTLGVAHTIDALCCEIERLLCIGGMYQLPPETAREVCECGHGAAAHKPARTPEAEPGTCRLCQCVGFAEAVFPGKPPEYVPTWAHKLPGLASVPDTLPPLVSPLLLIAHAPAPSGTATNPVAINELTLEQAAALASIAQTITEWAECPIPAQIMRDNSPVAALIAYVVETLGEAKLLGFTPYVKTGKGGADA